MTGGLQLAAQLVPQMLVVMFLDFLPGDASEGRGVSPQPRIVDRVGVDFRVEIRKSIHEFVEIFGEKSIHVVALLLEVGTVVGDGSRELAHDGRE